MLTSETHNQLFIPAGFAHGFCVLSDTAIFTYKCSAEYDPSCERGIRYDDPALKIVWPGGPYLLSPKDEILPTLEELKASEGLPSL